MGCISCGTDLPEGAAFCPLCGTPQAAPGCAQCGAELVARAAFCFKCGAPVNAQAPAPTAVVERRLTSVLFADLVGYTTISESRDTEDVRELLSAYFDTCQTVIKRYGGTVEKFIGDAVMAVWGVPVSYEDDAGRAVRTGLELVSEVAALGERMGVPELALRVGILSGEVTANLSASNQGIVAGDPVNTAARIQAAAPPGQVWVDPETRVLTSAAVRFEDMGEHELKGKTEPLRLYRATEVFAGRDGAQRVDGLEAPLVGRDRELRLLKELFHSTEESGRSQLVVLDGEAGVGKSRLGWEFEKYIDGLPRTVRWHRGRCVSYGDGVAFWALGEAVRGRLGLVEDDSGAAVVAALDVLLRDAVRDEQEVEWLRPRVASLLGEETREFTREDLFAAWTRLFDWLGADDPVALLIEDAQHADEGFLDFVEHLITNARAGCFVVLLARPDLLQARPQLGGRRSTALRIDPLPETAMTELVDHLVEGLTPQARTDLVARAEGIPLFAVETVRALIDRDLVVPVGGRYVVAPGATVDLEAVGAPASLHALVAARLDALDPSERKVVADASVLGQTFTREGIGILAADVADLDDVLARLTRKELIGTDSDRFSAERGQFRFAQSVVRQVSYETISRRDRKKRHLMVAEHLARDPDRWDELAQVIAQHLRDAAGSAAAGDPDVPELRSRASAFLVRAAGRAYALGAYADAGRCYRSALECEDDPGQQGRIMALEAAMLIRIGQPGEAVDRATAAVELLDSAGDVVGAADAAVSLSRSLSGVGRFAEAVDAAQTKYDNLAGHAGSVLLRGRLAAALARALYFTGRDDEVNAPLNEALRCADRTDDAELLTNACNVLALVQARHGSTQVARTLQADVARRAREREDWVTMEAAVNNMAVQTAMSDLTQVLQWLAETRSEILGRGIRPDIALVVNALHYQWLAGEWDSLAALVSEELVAPGHQGRVVVAATMIRLCRWAGRVDTLELPDFDHGADETLSSIAHHAECSRVLLESDDLAPALAMMRRAVQEEADLNTVFDDMHVFWPTAMRLALMAGDLEAVSDFWNLAADIEELPESASLQGHRRVFRAVRAIRSGTPDPDEVERDLRSGIDVLEKCGVVVWRAWAQEDLGRWLVDQGRADEGEAELRAARETYERLGATAWVARVRASEGVTVR
jgi:class 3 adenylate cyclase/tetratricopeptide (TPR) repeat protein